MTVTSTNYVPNNSNVPWGVLTSCSEHYKNFLFENPSKIGPTLNDGLIKFQNQGSCEIIKSGDFTYYIKAINTPIELDGKLLADGEVAKLESGAKITFSVENGTDLEIHNFVFSSIYTGVLEILIDKDRLQQLLGCSVCYEVIYDCVTLDCMHNFCADCIMLCLQNIQQCPYCKQKFQKLKKNPAIDDICQFYFQLFPLEEPTQSTKEKRKTSKTKSIFEDSDGNIYNGNWKGLKKHGEGEIKFKSGDSFKGLTLYIFLFIFFKGHSIMTRWKKAR